MRRFAKAASLSLPALVIASRALAHAKAGEGQGFVSGALHPLSGWDHILAMVAVGLWGAQLGAPALWLLPVTFPLIMALGGFWGLIGAPLPGAEVAIAASALGLGGAVALAWRAPLPLAVAAVAVFGFFHGYAHGAELPRGGDPVLYSAGFVLATGLLHLIGVAFGLLHRFPLGAVAVRVAGAVVFGGGALFLKAALR